MSRAKQVPIEGASKVEHAIDFVVVVAVPVERDAVLDVLIPLDGESAVAKVFEGDSVYYVGKIGLYSCAVVMCQMGATGRDSSILSTSAALDVWKPRAGIVMPGIAFGRFGPPTDTGKPPKQVLGDVVVATQVVAYEPARMGLKDVVPRGAHPETSLRFTNRLRNLDWAWRPEDGGDARSLIFGPMLSGEKLVDDPDFKEELFNEFPKAIAGEMEGAGVYAASSRVHAEWIVVKAICDWGDGNKAKEYQPLAAQNSVDAVAAMLGEPGLRSKDKQADHAAEALMRSKIELIRRADEVRQAKSGALALIVSSFVTSSDGPINVPPTMKATIETMTADHDVALEQWLNAYEDACGEFVAGTVGKSLFAASLGQEIKELIDQDGPHQSRLRPPNASPYKSIHAAYKLLTSGPE